MAHFVTSDPHLGHYGIIEKVRTEFRNIRHHDSLIIRNNNSIVSPDDDLWIVGDFSLYTKSHRGTLENYLRKMNGRKHLVMGNHDVPDARWWHDVGFFSIHYPYFELEEFVLAHDPSLSCVDRTRPFICGHTHDWVLFEKNVLIVCLELHEYKPLSLEQCREYFRQNSNISVKEPPRKGGSME